METDAYWDGLGLRYQERYRAPVLRVWRLCRFCRVKEDEVHVLLKCDARSESDLLALRAMFRQDAVTRVVGDVPWTPELTVTC
jgi:hypothetical protein